MNDNNTEENKILESIFEPNNAEILAYLESGSKTLLDLTKNLEITKEKIEQCLEYLMEKGFVSKVENSGQTCYSVEAENLSKVLENDDFQNIDDGLAKLDSFLN